jgi:hypothetical protein
MSAFRFNHCQDIDAVYPEDKSITQAQIASLLQILLTYTLDDESGKSVSVLMTIVLAFWDNT